MSDDQQQQLPTRPWTPGPWKAHSTYGQGDVAVPAPPYEIIADQEHDICENIGNEPDADLIALAPEMAEAILRFADWANKQPGLDPQEEIIELLAEKLRAI